MTVTFVEAAKSNYQQTRKDLKTAGNPLRSITKIIIHTMDGFFTGTVSWFQNPASSASAHYLVGLKGQMVQMVRESDAAYHATNYPYNLSSIGIECEDGRKPVSVRSDQLYESTAQLVADICRRYNIQCNRSNILKHNEVYTNKPCPGNLDVDRIVRRAQEILKVSPSPTTVSSTNKNFYPSARNVSVVAEKGINVRNQPTTSGKNIIRTIPYNTPVAVEGFLIGEQYSNNNLWWKLKGENSYIWTGATNVIPSITSQTQPTIAPVVVENVNDVSKETLNGKIVQLTNDINKLMKDVSDKDNAFQSLQHDHDQLKELLSKTEDQRLSFETIKAANESLVAQIEEYKTKLSTVKRNENEVLLRAFSGWQFFELPKGVSALASLPLAASKLRELLQGSREQNVVVGFKIGGKLVSVNNMESPEVADLSVLNS